MNSKSIHSFIPTLTIKKYYKNQLKDFQEKGCERFFF